MSTTRHVWASWSAYGTQLCRPEPANAQPGCRSRCAEDVCKGVPDGATTKHPDAAELNSFGVAAVLAMCAHGAPVLPRRFPYASSAMLA